MNSEEFVEYGHANTERQKMLSLIGFNKNVVGAEGIFLHCDDGTVITDFCSQYGVMILGHNNAEIVQSLRDHLTSHAPVMVQPLSTSNTKELARKLCNLVPGGGYSHVQFTNSGAETVEAALKLARSKTGRGKILATLNGFHGKTEGAVKATGKEIYREPFAIVNNNTRHIDFGNVEELASALETEEFAAFIVEAIQGEGGMNVAPPRYLQEAQRLCQRHGTLFIVDEIQTGLGRTGHLLACESEDVSPDMLLLAKGLSGGLLPIGALIAKEGVWTKDFGIYHSSTFANNDLAARVAIKTIDLLQNNNHHIIRQAHQTGDYLKSVLIDLTLRYPVAFEEVRGKGLMLGLKLRSWTGERFYLMSYASSVGFSVPIASGYLLNAHKILCLPTLNNSDILRIQPPLTVDRDDIDRLLTALADLGEIITAGRHEQLIEHLTKRASTDFQIEKPSSSKGVANVTAVSALTGRRLGKFAFLLHPVDEQSISGRVAFGSAGLSAEQTQTMSDWTRRVVAWNRDQLEAGTAYETGRLYDKHGDYVEGIIITSLHKPKELMALDNAEKRCLFDSYFEKAKAWGADYVGLGAYTSVISRSGLDVLDRGIHVTTGNSLTALSCAHALNELAESTPRSLATRNVAVAGAYGSVGRLCAIALSEKSKSLLLIGNPLGRNAQASLSNIAGEIYQHLLLASHLRNSPMARWIREVVPDIDEIVRSQNFHKVEMRAALNSFIARKFEATGEAAPIISDIRLDPWIPKIDALVTATSAGRSFINGEKFRKGTLVCDAAQPPDIEPRNDNQHIAVFSGGELWLPQREYRFGAQNISGLETGKTLACLGETIALTMSHVREHRSIGPEPSYSQAVEIFQMARGLGFEVASPLKENQTNITAVSRSASYKEDELC